MKKTTTLSLALLGSLLLSGCSMDASLEDLTDAVVDGPVISVQKAQLTGFVSGNSNAAPTPGGYMVESATGNYTNKLSASTNGGYKVFISVQGNIVSN